MAEPTPLQKEFAKQAQEESKNCKLGERYCPPWERHLLRGSSVLDEIYKELGKESLDVSGILKKSSKLPKTKQTKYSNTLKWLGDHLVGYQQVGNSCGACALTHRLMLEANEHWKCDKYQAEASNHWTALKFNSGDWSNTGLPPTIASTIESKFKTELVKNNYSDPWKIVRTLEKNKINSASLMILKDAEIAAKSSPKLSFLLTVVKQLKKITEKLDCTATSVTLPIGSFAILVTDAGIGLHYLLLRHSKAGYEVCDSNSQALNWTKQTAAIAFNSRITTQLLNKDGSSGGSQTYTFLGAYIVA